MLGKRKTDDVEEPAASEAPAENDGDLEILDPTDIDALAGSEGGRPNPLNHLSDLETQLQQSLQGGLKNVQAEFGRVMEEMNENLEKVQGALEKEKAAHAREQAAREALEAQADHHATLMAEARAKLKDLRHDLETARSELQAAAKRQSSLQTHLEASEERFASLASILGETEGDLGLDVPEIPAGELDEASFEVVEANEA